jgi:hypothetical protein
MARLKLNSYPASVSLRYEIQTGTRTVGRLRVRLETKVSG